MITLMPEEGYKWRSRKNGRIFPGNITLGNLDSPANYELVGEKEYIAQEEKLAKERKERQMKWEEERKKNERVN